MSTTIEINNASEISLQYQGTPISRLIEYHNLDRPLDKFDSAEILIGMCMDHRKTLRIPEKFAYIIRAGGANLRNSEFKISFAVAIGKVKHLAIIGHNHCGMVNLNSKKEDFINGLVENGGWEREKAEEHFKVCAPESEIGNEIDFVASEAKRLRIEYPKLTIAPMFYNVDNNKLYLIKE